MVSLDKTYVINELKIRIQSTCLMTHGERAFNCQYRKKVSIQMYAWKSLYAWRDCGKIILVMMVRRLTRGLG